MFGRSGGEKVRKQVLGTSKRKEEQRHPGVGRGSLWEGSVWVKEKKKKMAKVRNIDPKPRRKQRGGVIKQVGDQKGGPK